jgi:hypothetical protein
MHKWLATKYELFEKNEKISPNQKYPYLTSYPKTILKLGIWRVGTRTNEAGLLLCPLIQLKRMLGLHTRRLFGPEVNELVAQRWYSRR